MPFAKEKSDFLSKKDKSRKGSIDAKIKKLAEKINSSDNCFTTSSCAGRILLLALPKSSKNNQIKKNEVQYLFLSHEKINFNKIKKILYLKKLPKDDVWFRVEGAILHVACKDTESALKLLKIAREVGFRRSGIISLGKNRATIELVSTEKIDTIVAKKGKIIVDSYYLKILISEGNNKLEKAWKKIDNLNKHL